MSWKAFLLLLLLLSTEVDSQDFVDMCTGLSPQKLRTAGKPSLQQRQLL